MKKYNIGDKVKWNEGKAVKHGKIHAIKRSETPQGIVLGETYLVDTGKSVKEDLIMTPEGEEDFIVKQPEQVEKRVEELESD